MLVCNLQPFTVNPLGRFPGRMLVRDGASQRVLIRQLGNLSENEAASLQITRYVTMKFTFDYMLRLRITHHLVPITLKATLKNCLFA